MNVLGGSCLNGSQIQGSMMKDCATCFPYAVGVNVYAFHDALGDKENLKQLHSDYKDGPLKPETQSWVI